MKKILALSLLLLLLVACAPTAATENPSVPPTLPTDPQTPRQNPDSEGALTTDSNEPRTFDDPRVTDAMPLVRAVGEPIQILDVAGDRVLLLASKDVNISARVGVLNLKTLEMEWIYANDRNADGYSGFEGHLFSDWVLLVETKGHHAEAPPGKILKIQDGVVTVLHEDSYPNYGEGDRTSCKLWHKFEDGSVCVMVGENGGGKSGYPFFEAYNYYQIGEDGVLNLILRSERRLVFGDYSNIWYDLSAGAMHSGGDSITVYRYVNGLEQFAKEIDVSMNDYYRFEACRGGIFYAYSNLDASAVKNVFMDAAGNITMLPQSGHAVAISGEMILFGVYDQQNERWLYDYQSVTDARKTGRIDPVDWLGNHHSFSIEPFGEDAFLIGKFSGQIITGAVIFRP